MISKLLSILTTSASGVLAKQRDKEKAIYLDREQRIKRFYERMEAAKSGVLLEQLKRDHLNNVWDVFNKRRLKRAEKQIDFYIKAYNTLSSCYPPMSNKSRTHYNREQAILRRAKREILRSAIKVGMNG